ncbi:MAG TPA: ATP-binding protein [Burkholderiales bacterium]|nr:ATP-binding protein [Burkholderiales bacterium]
MNEPTLDDLAARAAELRRQQGISDRDVKPANGAPTAEWLTAVVPNIIADMQRKQAEAEEHAASCTADPCERCERYVCRCGAHVSGVATCPTCSARDAIASRLQPTRDSVPAGLGELDGITAAALAARVALPIERIERALSTPPSRNMLLMGPTRAGKTTLAIAMLYAWVRAERRRRGAIFVAARDLSKARRRYRLGDGEAPLVERALAAPLLLLDDLGQEAEDRDGCISDVIYGRYDSHTPTWITSGIDLPPGTEDDQLRGFAAALAARYDGGFVRRVLETGKPIRLGAR